MIEFAVVIWIGIAVVAFAAGLVGIANTRRRLTDVGSAARRAQPAVDVALMRPPLTV